jgi:hypothetical protein
MEIAAVRIGRAASAAASPTGGRCPFVLGRTRSNEKLDDVVIVIFTSLKCEQGPLRNGHEAFPARAAGGQTL